MVKHYRFLSIMVMLVLAACILPATSAENQAGYIVVGLAPNANFEAYYAYNIVPTQVRFADLSTGTAPLTYKWDFGDGATSTEVNPVHIYKARGIYTVKLTVTNAYGESTETKIGFITIGVGPVANFDAEPRIGTTPFVVQFTDKSIGHPTSWSWDFGDGTGSTKQNPSHTYWVGGRYTVTLTASNEYGSSDKTKSEFIIAVPPLKSKFIAYPDTGKAPLTVTFTDKSTGDPEAWSWDFGDGQTSTEQNPVHTFTSGGTYDVVLKVTKGEESDSSTGIINVGGVPVTDFVADKTSVNTYEVIKFTDKTKNNPTYWKWNFGDGTESMDKNPQKSYRVKGIYTVTLTTRNNDGKDTEVKKDYINVGMAPIANFISSMTTYQNVPSRNAVRFIDKSENHPTSWKWDFGDGQTSTEQNPRHVYAGEGSYTVSLTAINAFGDDTMVKTDLISIGKGPRVDFKADKTVTGVDRYIRFTDLSSNNPTTWVWDFGDGTTARGQNPDHAYRATGTYDVTLTASNEYTTGSLTKKQYITVLDLPRVNFYADRTKGQAPFSVKFTDTTKGNPISWAWDFGDKGTSTEQNPTHVYTENGVFTVSLTAKNSNGEDSETKVNYITVKMGPVADFTVDERVGKAPFIVEFKDLSRGNPTRWLWDFGDGTGSVEQNPIHVYKYEGAYDVRLSVWNKDGTDTILKTGTTK